MNKNEFITTYLAKKLNCSKAQAAKSLDTILECIGEALKFNEILRFVGFGTFKTKHMAKRKVTTPKGQVVTVPAKKQIRFAVGEIFKKAVNS